MLRQRQAQDRELLLAAIQILARPGRTRLARSYLAAGLRRGASLPVMSRRVVAGARRLANGSPTDDDGRLLDAAVRRAEAILEQGAEDEAR